MSGRQQPVTQFLRIEVTSLRSALWHGHLTVHASPRQVMTGPCISGTLLAGTTPSAIQATPTGSTPSHGHPAASALPLPVAIKPHRYGYLPHILAPNSYHY